MVDLEALECKIDDNLLAFEKGKVYCVKVHIYDYPKEFIGEYCKHLVEVFGRRGIEVIAIPIFDKQMDLEFFKVNKDDIKKSEHGDCI